jgi:putative (di)nucleoside polyphosphate hydrolase
MATKYFRAGVGAVIYTTAGELAFFRRLQQPAGIWQFPQGGIEVGEAIEDTLWRELGEEVGLTATDFTAITPLPEWTVYPDTAPINEDRPDRLGQAHQWFFLELTKTVTINLAQATEQEFDDWKWVTFADAVEQTSPHKQHVYRTLETFFNTNLKQQ